MVLYRTGRASGTMADHWCNPHCPLQHNRQTRSRTVTKSNVHDPIEMPVPSIVPPDSRQFTTPWRAFVIVAGSSFSTLVLELVMGRVLAPAIGVSLYTWTAVIGVVLGGIALGNDIGGRLARRLNPGPILEWALLGSAAWTLAIAGIAQVFSIDDLAIGLPPLVRLMVLVTACGFLPCILLGTTGPLVTHQLMATRDLNDAGPVVGRLNAVGTAGSIVGAFGTGFVFVPLFGTRTTLALVAVTLTMLGLASNPSSGRRSVRTGITVGLWAVAAWVVVSASFTHVIEVDAASRRLSGGRDRMASSPCLVESAYSCIRIDWSSVGQDDFGTMRLDRAIQGRTAPDAPRLLLSPISQALGDMIVSAGITSAGWADVDPTPRPLHALFIGGGSYTLPRYLEAIAPGSRIDVIELDPDVTAVAMRWLGVRLGGPVNALPTDGDRSGIIAHHADARQTIRRLPDAYYDVVIGDAFSDFAVPWHLTTVEFTREVHRVLRPDGRYAVNVIDGWPGGRFLPAFMHSLEVVFPEADVLATAVPGMEEYDLLQNWVATAGSVAIDANRLASQVRPGLSDGHTGTEPSRGRLVARDVRPEERERTDTWAEAPPWRPVARQVPALTDDRAPVDWYLASRVTG